MVRNLMGTLLISLLSVSALWTARADSREPAPTPLATPGPALTAASPTVQPTAESAATLPLPLPTQPVANEAAELPAPAPTATREPHFAPEAWRNWPVVPALNPAMFDLLRRGLERENNPRAYSVVGDCQSVPDVFMGLYNRPGVTLGKAK